MAITDGSESLPPLVENASGSPKLGRRLRAIWDYRELLANLVRRELKVKYKDSALGFVWTLLNPLLYLAVFSLVFAVFLRSNVPRFGLFLLCGLLTWNLFSIGLTAATTSITANGPLVQKVWFPREILPLAAIGASLVTFLFQLIVLLVGLLAFGQIPDWRQLPLLGLALLVTLVLTVGMGLLLSALNVYFRDVQHFLELGLLAWFWVTPIVYSYDLVAREITARAGAGADRYLVLNPMLPVVTTFQRVLYNPRNLTEAERAASFEFMPLDAGWYVSRLLVVGGAGLVVLVLGLFVFGRLEANLAEEI